MLILYFSLQQSDSNGLDHHLDDDDVISDGVNPTDTDKSDGNARLAVTLSRNNLLLNEIIVKIAPSKRHVRNIFLS